MSREPETPDDPETATAAGPSRRGFLGGLAAALAGAAVVREAAPARHEDEAEAAPPLPRWIGHY